MLIRGAAEMYKRSISERGICVLPYAPMQIADARRQHFLRWFRTQCIQLAFVDVVVILNGTSLRKMLGWKGQSGMFAVFGDSGFRESSTLGI